MKLAAIFALGQLRNRLLLCSSYIEALTKWRHTDSHPGMNAYAQTVDKNDYIIFHHMR